MKILITGANGYIGSHVVSYFIENTSHDVVAVDIDSSFIDKRATFIYSNIFDEQENSLLYNKFGNSDVLIHMAWRNGFNHKENSHIVDLPKHYIFLKNMIDSGIKSLAVMGSMHEIGYYEGAVNEKTPCNPLSLYGISKNALRQSILTYAEGKSVSVKWLRAYYIIGDNKRNKSIFSKIIELAESGNKTFPFTMGTNKYDFISIDELARQICEASIQTLYNGIINVCSGRPISLKAMVEKFIAKNGLDIQPNYGSYPDRKYDSPAIWGDNTKIKKILEKSNNLM